MTQDALFDVGPAEVTGWPDRPRYLHSYAYVGSMDIDLCRKLGIDLVMDSGAFTVASQGKTMDHYAYLEWLEEHADAVSFALSLDVIGDHRQSRINHEIAVGRIGDKVKMVPTFHLGSPMAELERMCRTYDFISIGGAVPFAKQKHQLATALAPMHRLTTEHGVKVHGLGMTGNRIVHGFPWYSVDSSAWLSPARFPTIPIANEDGKILTIEHGWKMARWEQELLACYGLDPSIMQTPGWSLKENVGQELALERRIQILTATAQAFMYVEAVKSAHQPASPIKVYLSGDQGIPGGSIQLLYNAHTRGNPWVNHRQQKG